MGMDVMRPIEVGNVRLRGELGRLIRSTVEGNILAVDVDGDFLGPFLPAARARRADGGFIGTGLLVDAVARLCRCDDRPDLALLRRRLVDTVLSTQEPDGYVGIFPPAKRVVTLWDINDVGCMIHGLVTNHRLWGEAESLRGACRLADWLMRAWRAGPERVPTSCIMSTLMIEYGMLDLHEATGNPAYRDFVAETMGLAAWDRPIVLGRWGRIEGHAYDYLFRCLAQLRLAGLRGDERVPEPTRRVLDFMLAGDGMVVTGEVGDHECWHDSQEGTINLGETCATAYVIRLMHALLARTGDPLYGDVMERAIHNALVAAQSPDGRRLRYYTAMEGRRRYFAHDTYCCPGNFRRIASELPAMVAYARDDGVAVNLYEPSTVRVPLGGGQDVTLTQETDYPRQGSVRLRLGLGGPGRFALRLRIPRWARTAEVRVNGRPAEGEATSGTFHEIVREWRDGDEVHLEMAMPLRLVRGRRAQAGRAAVLCGPTVFCLSRERHPALAEVDLRDIVIDPATLVGPTVEAGRLLCRVKAWSPGRWYPFAKTDLDLALTAFPDPDGELTYLKVPVPTDPRLEDDELLRGAEGPKGAHAGHDDGALPADLGGPGLGDFLSEAQRQERE